MEFAVETSTIKGYDRFQGNFLKSRCLKIELKCRCLATLTIDSIDTAQRPLQYISMTSDIQMAVVESKIDCRTAGTMKSCRRPAPDPGVFAVGKTLMTRHNLKPTCLLGAVLLMQAGALMGLVNSASAQGPEVGPGMESPDDGRRSRSDRGSRGDRGDRGGRGRREDMGSGDQPAGNQPPGKPGAKPKVRVGRYGPKAALPPATLPAQYAARDANRDGQIGLYEWSKTDISTFNSLDANRDGFLVPAELVNPAKPGMTVAVASPSAPAVTGAATVAAPASSAPAKPLAPAGPPVDPKTAAAESAFDFLDKEDASGKKDGLLSAEEWERSRNARKLFTDAKVEVQIPLSKAKFVENYVKLSK